jgi:hypothetical protein
MEEIAGAFRDKLGVNMTHGGKITHEHICQFLAQLGELADRETFHVRLLSLSLTGIAFAWYATLAPNFVYSWGI